MTPAVSVLMAVRNGEMFVREAIDSVLGQTLRELELVVVDDGSTDRTPAILAAVADARLRVHTQRPRGLTHALAAGFAHVRAPLIARLDADDVARPQRLARQCAFLAAHAEIGLLGTAAREVDATGRLVRLITPPTDDAAIRASLIRANPFVHSSVVMRREVAERAGGYDPGRPVAQDYALWMRMSRITRLANLPDVLVVRRLMPGRVGATRDGDRLRAEAAVRWAAIRAGQYPWWAIVFMARPAMALALPGAWRRALRRALPGGVW
jgi:glycosyltransferase involved in cell wall biosynthesis